MTTPAKLTRNTVSHAVPRGPVNTTTEPVSATVPLPRVGRCPQCGDEVRLAMSNALYKHPAAAGYTSTAVAAPLEPTFLRWLWAHRARRDARTNRITLLAEFTVGLATGCGADRVLEDVPWTTADELHDHLHSGPRAVARRTGCDWLCAEVRRAADIHQALVAGASSS